LVKRILPVHCKKASELAGIKSNNSAVACSRARAKGREQTIDFVLQGIAGRIKAPHSASRRIVFNRGLGTAKNKQKQGKSQDKNKKFHKKTR